MSKAEVRIAVFGAAGRMGRAIIRDAAEEGLTLTCAIDREGSPDLGSDAAGLAGLPPSSVLVRAQTPDAGAADVWIDFSTPAATRDHLPAAIQAGAPIVVGTTGLSEADKSTIAEAAKNIPVVYAPNMSVGVNVLLELVATAARTLGPSFDIEIVEAHHRAKRDAPSGTALRLAEAAAEATARNLDEAARYARHGDIGPRSDAEIGIQTLRGGDVVGDHTVFFLGTGERIELTHRASSRQTFARGALRAARWLAARGPGLYDMRDVLGGHK